MSKEITLTKGYVAIVDDEDYERVSQFKWHAVFGTTGVVYAQSSVYSGDHPTTVKLHRLVLGIIDPEIDVDHEDRNGLNCQRYNLRLSTPHQNLGNRKKTTGCTSMFKGVSWDKRQLKWHSRITTNYKRIHLGFFASELKAALAYDTAAIQCFGEFALTNAMMGLL